MRAFIIERSGLFMLKISRKLSDDVGCGDEMTNGRRGDAVTPKLKKLSKRCDRFVSLGYSAGRAEFVPCGFTAIARGRKTVRIRRIGPAMAARAGDRR
jgi:hypothetical protein